MEGLLQKGVIVKPWQQEGFDAYVRVSIGSPEENDQFMEGCPICSGHVRRGRNRGVRQSTTDDIGMRAELRANRPRAAAPQDGHRMRPPRWPTNLE
jgi:hypothetical protein